MADFFVNQSSLQASNPSGLHVAIIMDGSGRWAVRRGLARSDGHRAGVDAVRRAVAAAPNLGIDALTLYAFSSDNWGRPRDEVTELLRIFRDFLTSEACVWVARGVRAGVIGRRDRLPADLLQAMADAEAATSAGRQLDLRFAIDYSGQEALLQAASRLRGSPRVSRDEFTRALAEVTHQDPLAGIRDADLLVRTGGEQRLSDFLLWEIAYAEMVFTKRLWPDFGAEDLELAVREFQSRERRFGRIPEPVGAQ